MEVTGRACGWARAGLPLYQAAVLYQGAVAAGGGLAPSARPARGLTPAPGAANLAEGAVAGKA